jgi:SAM-dependent methyltransferase
MVGRSTLLHQDDGLVSTRVQGEQLADLEFQVISQFMTLKGRVLDIGCGHGRACRYLGLDGFEAIGVDMDSETLQDARRLAGPDNSAEELVLADGRQLCFQDQSFDYLISLASTLSEKHRLWMSREDRICLIHEGARVLKPGGLMIVNFVHRYWGLKSFFSFFRNYRMWISEKTTGKRTEFGDYVERIGRTPIRFHAFTIREARLLFPRDLQLQVWRRGRGPFTDWFFIIAKRTS